MRTDRALALLLLLAPLAGCSTTHMDVVPRAERLAAPPPGSSMVVFVRPPAFGGSDAAILLDGDQYIGTLDSDRHICWVAAPGKHLFTVISEAADFMEADLEADKTYYATVRRRMGVWQERFSFVAHNDPRSIGAARKIEGSNEEVRANATGHQFYEKQRSKAEYIRNRWTPRWQSNQNKQVLYSDSGR
jgi:hypothetical protein